MSIAMEILLQYSNCKGRYHFKKKLGAWEAVGNHTSTIVTWYIAIAIATRTLLLEWTRSSLGS